MDPIRKVESGYSVQKARVRYCSSRLNLKIRQSRIDSQSSMRTSPMGLSPVIQLVLYVLLGQYPKLNPTSSKF